MLNDQPRQQLHYLIAQYSPTVCDDARRCEAILKDLCPEYKRELNLLIAALKEKIPQELSKAPAHIPPDFTIKLLAQRLHDHLGIAEHFAFWAVESWALALNIIQQNKTDWQDEQTGIEFLLINAGSFLMGSNIGEPDKNPNERLHKVTIEHDFYLAKYPITQAQWQSIMGNNPSQFRGDRHPVERVSWLDVQQFIEKLSTLSKQTFRLPTEAEWEYACRAGTTTAFYTGDNLDLNQANFANQIGKTSPIGLYPANPWGLYDMIGNVLEWTGSEYDEHYQGLETKTAQKGASSWRVVRGGLWNSEARNLRSANRHSYTADFRYSSIGFRLVRV